MKKFSNFNILFVCSELVGDDFNRPFDMKFLKYDNALATSGLVCRQQPSVFDWKCTPCPQGTYGQDAKCVPCPPGMFAKNTFLFIMLIFLLRILGNKSLFSTVRNRPDKPTW